MEAPSLEMTAGGVQVGDVAERVKCEIANAFGDRIDQPYFQWMHDWTVRVDLILQANALASLNPNGSYTKNYHNAYNTAAGPTTISASGIPGNTIAAIPQFFNFGLSASVSDQTFRTETVSFSLSLAELKQWRDAYKKSGVGPDLCPPPNSTGVGGNLGLKEWVDASLDAVSSGRLQSGFHPAPLTSPKPTTPAPPSASAPASQRPLAAPFDRCLENPKSRSLEIATSICWKFVKTIYNIDQPQQNDQASDQKPPSPYTYLCGKTEPGKRDFLGDDFLQNQGPKYDTIDNELRKSVADTRLELLKLYNREKALEIVLIESARKPTHESWNRFFTEIGKDYLILKRKVNRSWAFSDLLDRKLKIDQMTKDVQLASLEDGRRLCHSLQDESTCFDQRIKPVQLITEGQNDDDIRDADCKNGPDCKRIRHCKRRIDYSSIGFDLSKDQESNGYVKAFTGYKKLIDTDVTSAQEALPDPPVDILSHAVQFNISLTAGVNPSWTLAAWKGPGQSATGNLLSATGARQHILNIAIGPTGQKSDAQRVLNNLAITEAFRQ